MILMLSHLGALYVRTVHRCIFKFILLTNIIIIFDPSLSYCFYTLGIRVHSAISLDRDDTLSFPFFPVIQPPADENIWKELPSPMAMSAGKCLEWDLR